MSTDQATNTSDPGTSVAPSAGSGKVEGIPIVIRPPRRQRARGTEHLDPFVTEPRGNHFTQEQRQTEVKDPEPARELEHEAQGGAALGCSAESAVQLNARLTTFSRLCDAETGVPQALTHLEATGEPPCSEGSSAAPVQTDPCAVVDQRHENLLEMLHPQRQELLTGPRITIHVGNTIIEGIYKRSAMAASSTLHSHFTDHPESLEYRFEHGQVHPGAVSLLLLGWVHETCNEPEAHAVPQQEDFAKGVAVLRAAYLLGMDRYCTDILTAYTNYLKWELPTYEEIALVEQNATSDKDPLWTALVNNLCNTRYRDQIPDPEEFEQFLEEHSRLKRAMEVTDAYLTAFPKKDPYVSKTERRQRKLRNRAERDERILRERREAAALKKDVDMTDSGLTTATADEAGALRDGTST